MRATLGAGLYYILVISKNISLFKEKLNILEQSEDQVNRYKNPDNDPKGPWISADFMAKGYRPNQMYEITTPSGKNTNRRPGSCWRNIDLFTKHSYLKEEYGLVRTRILYQEKKHIFLKVKVLLLGLGDQILKWVIIRKPRKECDVPFGMEDTFETPKPERLLKELSTLPLTRVILSSIPSPVPAQPAQLPTKWAAAGSWWNLASTAIRTLSLV